jgi:hypothetical protein
MYKFRVVLNILATIFGVLFSILDIISRTTTNLIIIVVSLTVSLILQLTANESMGEAKLQPNGFITYIILGVIGGLIFRPFIHGFFILNNLFDGVMTMIALPSTIRIFLRR